MVFFRPVSTSRSAFSGVLIAALTAAPVHVATAQPATTAAQPVTQPGPQPPQPATQPGPQPAQPSSPQPKANPVPTGPEIFNLPQATPGDPYGPQPSTAPKLTRDQVVRYALENPLIKAAEAEIEAMKQVLQKAKFAWIPTVRTSVALAPGVNIECDDVTIPTTEGGEQSFQYCRPPGGGSIYNIRDFLSQIGGVLVRFNFDLVVPIYTFGKFKNVKKMATAGVALRTLERERYRQETVLRVYQAYATLQLARESITILDEAWSILTKARSTIQTDLGDEDSEPEEINEERDPADLTRLELAELEIEERMVQARAIEAQALAALRALGGRAAPANFDIVDTPLQPDAFTDGMQPVAHYRKLSASHRPEAKQAGEFVELRKAAEKLARSNFLPDIGLIVQGKFQYISSADTPTELYYSPYYNYNLLFVALGLQWKLDFHNYTWDLRKARAERVAAEHRFDAAKILLGLEVDKAYQNVRMAAQRVELTGRAIKKSRQLVADQQVKETIGGGDFEKLATALKSWGEWRFKQVEAIYSHNVAVAELSRAVGKPLVSDDAKPPG